MPFLLTYFSENYPAKSVACNQSFQVKKGAQNKVKCGHFSRYFN